MQKNVSRRELLKLGLYGATGMYLIPLSLLGGCATIGLEAHKEPTPVHYPGLPGKKIQSPEYYGLEGCYTGIYYMNQKEYYRWVNKTLSILVIEGLYNMVDVHKRYRQILGISKEEKLEKATIPFLWYDLEKWMGRRGGLDVILSGKWDSIMQTHAQNARKIGEKQGGFFFRILHEMNIRKQWPPWRGEPKKYKMTWKHIWHIFNEEGANEYATWVFNPYSSSSRGVDSWEWYYPGDKYVDWIGIDGYNFGGFTSQTTRYPTQSFFNLFVIDYNKMRKYYPNKPMMLVEVGMHESKSKPKWVAEAFETTKNDFPGIKALIWWSINWSHLEFKNYDSRINSSEASFEAYKKGVSDPYFFGAVPYLRDI